MARKTHRERQIGRPQSGRPVRNLEERQARRRGQKVGARGWRQIRPQTPAGVAAPKSAPTLTALAPTMAASGGFDALLRDGQATMTTWLTAMSLLGQGAEEVSAAWSTFYRGSVETGFAVGKDLLRAKSFDEAIELQRDYTTRGLESLVTETTKLTEISVKAAGAASAPVVAHYDQT